MAREERKKGNRALVAYKKIQVNGEWKSWSDITMKQQQSNPVPEQTFNYFILELSCFK